MRNIINFTAVHVGMVSLITEAGYQTNLTEMYILPVQYMYSGGFTACFKQFLEGINIIIILVSLQKQFTCNFWIIHRTVPTIFLWKKVVSMKTVHGEVCGLFKVTGTLWK